MNTDHDGHKRASAYSADVVEQLINRLVAYFLDSSQHLDSDETTGKAGVEI